MSRKDARFTSPLLIAVREGLVRFSCFRRVGACTTRAKKTWRKRVARLGIQMLHPSASMYHYDTRVLPPTERPK